MTSPVAVVGLLYDGSDLQSADLQRFFEIERGLDEVPSVRGKDTVIPGLAGRLAQNRKNDTLSIVLKGFIQADPTITDLEDRRSSFRANAQSLRLLFAPDRDRADLVALLEDGSTQTISALPLNIIGGLYVASEYRAYSIELEGYDDWEASGS